MIGFILYGYAAATSFCIYCRRTSKAVGGQSSGSKFWYRGYFVGRTRKQDPLVTGEFHLVWRIRPSFWASLDTTYFWGGRTTVGDEPRFDLQRNSRIGGRVAVPFGGRHVLKLSVNSGMFISFGGDYASVSMSYQYGWISGD
ncbi:MAG: hypothetical protein ACWGQW_09395 [bacterium]